jgi:hypothetical protein
MCMRAVKGTTHPFASGVYHNSLETSSSKMPLSDQLTCSCSILEETGLLIQEMPERACETLTPTSRKRLESVMMSVARMHLYLVKLLSASPATTLKVVDESRQETSMADNSYEALGRKRLRTSTMTEALVPSSALPEQRPSTQDHEDIFMIV